MVDMRQAQHNIVQRLRDRTEVSVDTIERTVAMTGLKLDELLASIGDGGTFQGGPFVAGDYTGDFDGDAELEISLSLLDLRLSRWSALQRVMRKIGRASCRERVCQYVSISVVAGSLKKKNTS